MSLKLSVLIPTLREAHNLEDVERSIEAALGTQRLAYEMNRDCCISPIPYIADNRVCELSAVIPPMTHASGREYRHNLFGSRPKL